MPSALAAKCFWNSSNEPKNSSIAAASSPVGLVAAVGGEVLPEHRVVDVATEVEREVLLVQVHGGEVVGVAGLGELLERGVGAGHVRRVVLVVVQLHDPARDVRLECRVVVGQIREASSQPCVSTPLLRRCWGPRVAARSVRRRRAARRYGEPPDSTVNSCSGSAIPPVGAPSHPADPPGAARRRRQPVSSAGACSSAGSIASCSPCECDAASSAGVTGSTRSS